MGKFLGVAKWATLKDVDPRMVEVVKAAIAAIPFDGQIVSGHRPKSVTLANGTVKKDLGNHSNGYAIDIQLYTPEGKKLPNRGTASYAAYEQYAQAAKVYASQKYPDMPLRTGLGFGTVTGGKTLDPMHLDNRPGGTMPWYSWETGGLGSYAKLSNGGLGGAEGARRVAQIKQSLAGGPLPPNSLPGDATRRLQGIHDRRDGNTPLPPKPMPGRPAALQKGEVAPTPMPGRPAGIDAKSSAHSEPAPAAPAPEMVRLPSGQMIQTGAYPSNDGKHFVTITSDGNGNAVVTKQLNPGEVPGVIDPMHEGKGTLAGGAVKTIVQQKVGEAVKVAAPQVQEALNGASEAIKANAGNAGVSLQQQVASIGSTLSGLTAGIGSLASIFSAPAPKPTSMQKLVAIGQAVAAQTHAAANADRLASVVAGGAGAAPGATAHGSATLDHAEIMPAQVNKAGGVDYQVAPVVAPADNRIPFNPMETPKQNPMGEESLAGIPPAVRVFASSLLGDRGPITARDFAPSELKALEGIVQNAEAEGRDFILYQDYGDKARAGATLSGDIKQSWANTIGMAKFKRDPEGRITITDKYDWNTANSSEGVNDLINAAKHLSFTGVLEALGGIALPEGQGRPVKISWEPMLPRPNYSPDDRQIINDKKAARAWADSLVRSDRIGDGPSQKSLNDLIAENAARAPDPVRRALDITAAGSDHYTPRLDATVTYVPNPNRLRGTTYSSDVTSTDYAGTRVAERGLGALTDERTSKLLAPADGIVVEHGGTKDGRDIMLVSGAPQFTRAPIGVATLEAKSRILPDLYSPKPLSQAQISFQLPTTMGEALKGTRLADLGGSLDQHFATDRAIAELSAGGDARPPAPPKAAPVTLSAVKPQQPGTPSPVKAAGDIKKAPLVSHPNVGTPGAYNMPGSGPGKWDDFTKAISSTPVPVKVQPAVAPPAVKPVTRTITETVTNPAYTQWERQNRTAAPSPKATGVLEDIHDRNDAATMAAQAGRTAPQVPPAPPRTIQQTRVVPVEAPPPAPQPVPRTTKSAGEPVPAGTGNRSQPVYVDKATGAVLHPVTVNMYDADSNQWTARTVYRPATTSAAPAAPAPAPAQSQPFNYDQYARDTFGNPNGGAHGGSLAGF